jgi:hypothetical protein
MSTRPERKRYLLSTSPWRFSSADPARPGGAAVAGEIAHALEPVGYALVRGQRLLGDHVAHQADEVRVGDAGRPGTELGAGRVEAVGAQHRRVRQHVRRLPRRIHGLEERQHVGLRPRLQLVEHLQLGRLQVPQPFLVTLFLLLLLLLIRLDR